MIVLALTVLAVAASAAATGYVDGREYVYRYNGAIYTSYPGIKPQEAGYAVDGVLSLQPQGDQAIFKVSEARRAKFNAEFEDVVRAPHAFTDLPPHADILSRPFRVTRRNGKVTSFEVSRDEPSFSVNLKRAIVSLFDLNFEQADSRVSNKVLDSQAHYYKVYEESVLGDCETAYVIQHQPYDRWHNNVLNVTKVFNYHKCRTRPNQVYSVFHGHECGRNEYDKAHTLHGSAQVHYSLRGDRDHYVIEGIRTDSDVAYTPYPLRGERVSLTIKRSLELIEEKPVVTRLQLPDDLVSQNSLVHDFSFQQDFRDPVDLKQPHYMYHLTGMKVPISHIRQQMEELVNVYQDDTYREKMKDRNHPAKFVELVRSVATLGYDEIQDLYRTYADIPETGATEEQKRYRNLFFDTLVHLGTNPAFLFGKYLVESKQVFPGEADYFIRRLQFHLKEVSEVLLDKFQELCDSESVKNELNLHLACVISLSNVVFERCIARYHPEGLVNTGKNDCPPDAAVKYFNYIARLYDKTTNERLKVEYLKAGSNIGVEEILPYVQPYVEGHVGTSLNSRDNAIWALKNVGHRYPDKVRSLLVPLLANRTENYELRLSAFVLLMQFRPQTYEIEGMARAVKYDPDDQVRAYVYSTFKSLANSSHPCDRQLSADVQYGLRILEDVKDEFERYDFSYSTNNYFAGYDSDYGFGGSTRFAYFASDTGYIPRTMYLGFADFLGGKSMYTIGLGMKQYGMEKFFDKFFGPEGSFGKRSIFDLFKKRDKRDVGGARKELKEVREKMKFPVQEYDKLFGEIFFKYMGNHQFSYHFDESTFEQFFKNGRFAIPDIPAAYRRIPAFYYQRYLLAVDQFYVLPTDTGIPLFFDYKQPVYLYYRNKQSGFRVEPGFFPEDRRGRWPEHVRMEMDGHVAIDKNLIAYMGVAIPFDQVFFGGGINRRLTLSLPLKLKLDLAVEEKKLKTHWTPVAPHEIFHFRYEPFTFVDSYANSVPQVLEDGYKPVRRVHRHEVERSFFHDEFGFGLDVKADYENEFNDFGSWVDFFLQKDFRQRFYYLEANPHFQPYHVDVQFRHADQGATKELNVDFTYQFHRENWIIPHFPEEHFDDYHREMGNRIPLYTHVLKTDVRGHGDKERKIHAVGTWTRDLQMTFHKVNFFYERTPFASHETGPTKACGSSYLKYPMNDLFAATESDHGVKTEMRVHFGENCNSEQKIEVQGLMSKSEQQGEFESRREEPDTPEHYNEYSRWHHRCEEEKKRGVRYGEGCTQYWHLETTLNKYTFHIKHENLSPAVLNRTYLLDRILKFVLYTHSDHDEVGVHNPVDEVNIEANFSSKLPVADIRVRKPTSNTNYFNVYFPRYIPYKSNPLLEDMHIKNTYNDLYCNVEAGDEVSTFDRYTYSLPPIDCYTVVAMDCSRREYFAVLAASIKHARYHKALKVFLGNHKIEALPASEDSDDLAVHVDGQRVPVGGNEPYLHPEGDELLFYVTRRNHYYDLRSDKYGVVVEYDGDAVSVKVSPYYRNKLCGLCGNYNGQRHDGSSTAEGCYYRDEAAYAYSYAIPSDTCSVPKPELVCPEQGGFGCTRLRTKVLQLTSGGVPQTCFSTEPVSECANHCQPSGWVSRMVSFHCLPAKDEPTRILLGDSEFRVLYELRRKSKDHETTLEVPEICHKK